MHSGCAHTRTEADLGMFNVFGRPGAPTKVDPRGHRMSDNSATFYVGPLDGVLRH